MDSQELQRLLAEAEEEREKVAEEHQRLIVQQANLQELVSAVKDNKGAVAKMAEWHSKLGELRLKEMRQGRLVTRMEGRLRQVEGLLANSEQNCAQLEEKLAQATKVKDAKLPFFTYTSSSSSSSSSPPPPTSSLTQAHEADQMMWEERETELMQQSEKVTDSVHHTMATLPPPPLPPQQAAAPTTDGPEETTCHVAKLEAAVRHAEEEIMKRDRRLAELQQQLRMVEEEGAGREREREGEVRQALQLANDTIDQLKVMCE